MRLVSLLVLVFFLNFPPSTAGPKIDTEQPDISRFGTGFLKLCLNIESQVDDNPLHIYNHAPRNVIAMRHWIRGKPDAAESFQISVQSLMP